MEYVNYYDTPIGKLSICADAYGVTSIDLSHESISSVHEIYECPIIKIAAVQLYEYFEGKRFHFDFPLNLKGTQFQKKVWDALMNIPYGKTVTYKDIAMQIGNPKASRAIGMANNKNPIPIVVPCHRVIGSNGSLIGYAYGLDVKKQLLDLEMSHSTNSIQM